ncbi:MAG TPA: hypothetical protein VN327_04360 [Pseudonocardiaceae bacterium]|nr:hypothetical protein [Pseudonocardiaceae bacterium]
MNEANPTPEVGEYVSTAPCAEVGLVVGETCQFGYVNLGRFHTGSGAIPVDWDALTDTVRKDTHLRQLHIQARLGGTGHPPRLLPSRPHRAVPLRRPRLPHPVR